jgi:hypothetical protein
MGLAGMTVPASASVAPAAQVRGLTALPSTSAVSLSWTPPAARGLHDLVIRRASGRTAPASPTSGAAVADVPASARTVADAGLPPNSVYSYAVFAHYSDGRFAPPATRTIRLRPSQWITGHVTYQGAAIPGVKVTARRVSDGRVASTAQSAADGSYRLGGLAADVDYSVCFNPGAVANQPVGGYVQSCWGDVGSSTLFVRAGGTRSGVDDALQIGGEVTGRLTDLSGNPLAGVVVTATTYSSPRTATTAANGSYRIRGIDSDRTQICFDPAHATGGTSTSGYQKECFKDQDPDYGGDTAPVLTGQVTPGIDQALMPRPTVSGTVLGPDGPLAGVSVSVDGGAPAVTDAHGAYVITAWDGQPGDQMCFTPPPASGFGQACRGLYGLAYTSAFTAVGADFTFGTADLAATITGTVTDDHGVPLAGVTVGDGESQGDTVTTDAAGHYTISDAVPGSYSVCLNPGDETTPAAPAGYVGACPGVIVNAGQVTELDAQLARGAGVTGVVTDAAGHPLPKLTVEIGGTDGVYAYPVTDAAGRYRASGLPAQGDYYMSFLAGGMYGSYPGWTYLGGTSPTGYLDQCWKQVRPYNLCTALTLTAGHVTGGISAVLDAGGAVRGLVTNPAGHPLRHVTVYLRGPTNDYETTDINGRFDAIRLQPGDYTICYSGQTVSASVPFQTVCPTATITVSIGRTTSLPAVQLTHPPMGTIRGQVTDSGGHPVAGVVVTTNGGQALTATDGSYELDRLPTGRVSVCFDPEFVVDASPYGYLAQCSGQVVVRNGGLVTGIDAALATAGSVAGTVTDSAGHPLRDVAIDVSGYPAWAYREFHTDSSGRYRLTGLPDGSYGLTFRPTAVTGTGPEGLGLAGIDSVPVDVTLGVVTPRDETLASLGGVSGVITDDAGQPVPVASVWAYDPSSWISYAATTGADGSYRITGVPVGTYSVCYQAPITPRATWGYATGCYDNRSMGAGDPVTVAAGALTPISATMPRLGRLQLRVTDSSGQSAPDVTAFLEDPVGNIVDVATTDSDGRWLSLPAVPGSYSLQFPYVSENGTPLTVEVSIAPDATVEYDQQLPPQG